MISSAIVHIVELRSPGNRHSRRQIREHIGQRVRP
jgi:hypothetical protein